jgi:hypothetical protein
VKGLENDKVIGPGCPREHPKGTPGDVTSSSRGSPTGDIWWRHFRWKDPNRPDIAQLPVVHASTLPMETPSGSRDVTSGSYIGHAQFCTTTIVKKSAGTGCAFTERDWRHFLSRTLPVTSFPVRFKWLPVTSLPVSAPFAPPEIWLCPCWYATNVLLQWIPSTIRRAQTWRLTMTIPCL